MPRLQRHVMQYQNRTVSFHQYRHVALQSIRRDDQLDVVSVSAFVPSPASSYNMPMQPTLLWNVHRNTFRMHLQLDAPPHPTLTMFLSILEYMPMQSHTEQ